jgi:hypothetical protein
LDKRVSHSFLLCTTTLVEQNRPQPSPKTKSAIVGVQRFERSEESLLHDVFGQILSTEPARRNSQQHSLVLLNQQRKLIRFTSQNGGDDHSFGLFLVAVVQGEILLLMFEACLQHPLIAIGWPKRVAKSRALH